MVLAFRNGIASKMRLCVVKYSKTLLSPTFLFILGMLVVLLKGATIAA